METTKRKEWGSPRSMIQCFAPQEFVAGCSYTTQYIPAAKSAEYYKIDGLRQGKTHSVTPNGFYDHEGEQITVMHDFSSYKNIFNHMMNGDSGYSYHIDKAYFWIGAGNLPVAHSSNPLNNFNSGNWTPVAVIHQTSGSGITFYLLSNTYIDNNIDSYASVVKNNS